MEFDSAKLMKSLNSSIKESRKLMDSVITSEMYDVMTPEQKIKVDGLRKDVSIFGSDNINRKEEAIKKHL